MIRAKEHMAFLVLRTCWAVFGREAVEVADTTLRGGD